MTVFCATFKSGQELGWTRLSDETLAERNVRRPFGKDIWEEPNGSLHIVPRGKMPCIPRLVEQDDTDGS